MLVFLPIFTKTSTTTNMKTKYFSLLLFSVMSCLGLSAQETPKTNQDTTIFIVIEQSPEFPGGIEGLHAYLQKNLTYPKRALKKGIEGKVFVTFVVEKDGSISNIRILRGIGYGCDKEAIRVVRRMPKWKPGRQRGENVRVQFNLPIVFQLQEEETL